MREPGKIKLQKYHHKNYQFLGISEGGIQTAVAFHQFHLMFDIGVGSPRLTDIPRLLLTHGHLDHASGVAYYVSQRSLRRLEPPEIYCPLEVKEPLEKILNLWGEIEGFENRFHITGTVDGHLYPIHANYYFKSIRSLHRVPSSAYMIVEKTHKLKEEYRNLPGNKIAELKHNHEDIFYESNKPLVVFSGDTKIELVLENEEIQKTKILFLECTYIDDKRPVERARQWGHIHLDEIIENAEAFRNIEKLFLIHFSPRYSNEDIAAALKEKMPSWLYAKTTPFYAARP